MKKLLCFAVLIILLSGVHLHAQCEQDDYIALRALYLSTGGDNWNSTYYADAWPDSTFFVANPTMPAGTDVGTWYRVTTDADGCVTRLRLDGNALNGVLPSELGNLSDLTELHIGNNQLSGVLPTELGNLSDLTELHIGNNQLSGVLPAELGNLTNLTNLTLGNNQLSGVLPSELGNLSNLIWLNLYDNQLSGSIPSELGNLSNLTTLGLDRNQLSGSIPSELGNLSSLIQLNLDNNQLSGIIPPELGNLSSLTNLYLSTNTLNGSIPSELGQLSNLERLWLDNNQISGIIPPELGNLSSLTSLYLGANTLNGSIPSELGQLSNLERLYLFTNSLSGTLPSELSNLTNLIYLIVNDNQLNGCYDSSLSSLCLQLNSSSNQNISNGNNFDAPWEDFCATQEGICTNCQEQDYIALRALYLSTDGDNWTDNTNWLTEAEFIANETMPADTDVGTWYGVTTDVDGCVTCIDMDGGDNCYNNSIGNNLVGSIPLEIGNLNNLTHLYLSFNNLSGSIPPELGNLNNLIELNLRWNNLSGSIPPELGNLNNLTDLRLYDNNLSDSIPPELGNLDNLIYLLLNHNELNCSIPPELGNLNNLTHLYLSSNNLSGGIPPELGSLNNLMDLSVNDNQLNGCYDTNLMPICAQLDTNSINQYISDGNNFDSPWEDFCSDTVGVCIDCQEQDYLALRALYLSTDGDNWTDNTNWLTEAEFIANETMPAGTDVSTWYGVTTNADGCVICIDMDGVEGCLSDSNDGNNLVGVIPPELGNLSHLTHLGMHHNMLSGGIPPELGSLSNLVFLDLDFNQLSGNIPPELGNLTNLLWLILNDNQLSGCYDSNLSSLCTQLETQGNSTNEKISVGNNFDATWEDFCAIGVDACIVPPCQAEDYLALRALYFSTDGDNWTDNTGWLTATEFMANPTMPAGTDVNTWYGVTTENGCVTRLVLGNNNLNGSIPTELGNLSSLQWLKLDNNQLSGNLPMELGNLGNMTHLYLFENNLDGCYHPNLMSLCNQLDTDANTNEKISDGNCFTIPWEDFCAGVSCTLNIDPQDVTIQTGDNGIYDCIGTIPNYQDPIVNGMPNPLYTATDTCSIVVQDPPPGTIFDDGGVCNDPITVTVIATDSAGNSDTGTATVTLNDNVDPLITCPAAITVTPAAGDCDGEEVTIPIPIYVEPTLDANGVPIAPSNPANPATGAYTDDCDCVSLSGPFPGNGVSLDGTNTGTFPLGTTTVTYTATDAAGNTATCTFTVTVLPPDPAIVCNGAENSSATLNVGENCEAVHTWPSPTLLDCSSSVPIAATCTYPDNTSAPCASGDIFPLGITIVTFEDASAGDNPDCTFTVTVVDNTPPVLECLADVTLTTSESGDIYDCEATIPDFLPELEAGTDGSFFDNCEAAIATQSPAQGTVWGGSHNSTQAVAITVTDEAGNSTTCELQLTLIDDENPEIDCPADITVDANDNCQAVVSWPEPPTNDNCGVVSLTSSHNSSDTFSQGTTMITYTVTDVAGNTATCTFVVTVLTPDPSDGCDLTEDSFDAVTCTIINTPPDPNDDCEFTDDSFDTDNCLIINASNCPDGTELDEINCACEEEVILGCIDPCADNYDSLATQDDGSCVLPSCNDGCDLTIDSLDPMTCECVNMPPDPNDDCNLTEDSFDVATCMIVNTSPDPSDGCDLTEDSFDAATCTIVNTPPDPNDGCEFTDDSFDTDNCLIINASNCPDGTELDEINCACEEEVILGCIDPCADNYDSLATQDDGSCVLPSCNDGCDLTIDSLDPMTCECVNMPPDPNDDCNLTEDSFDAATCMIVNVSNCPTGTELDEVNCTCVSDPILGCTDTCATNYDSRAEQDDGSCQYPTEPPTECYQTATFNDVSCEWEVSGAPTDLGITNIETMMPTSCTTADGQITIEAEGTSAPFEYSIDGGNNFQNDSIFTALSSGIYNIVVRDSYECLISQDDTLTFSNNLNIDTIITIDPSICLKSDGEITILLQDGTPPFEYSMDGGMNFQPEYNVFANLGQQTYEIVVRDADGCTVNATATLTEEGYSPNVNVPAGITPNGDGNFDVLEIKSLRDPEYSECFTETHLTIFNRWGNPVYVKKNYGIGDEWTESDWWDGTCNMKNCNGELLPKGTYYYILYVSSGEPEKGSVFIL